MMFFHGDIIFVLSLIALSMGAGILLKAKKYQEMHRVAGCKTIGYLVVFLSIVTLIISALCTINYFAYKYRMYKGQGQMMQQMQMMKMQQNMQSNQQGMSNQQNIPMQNQQPMPSSTNTNIPTESQPAKM